MQLAINYDLDCIRQGLVIRLIPRQSSGLFRASIYLKSQDWWVNVLIKADGQAEAYEALHSIAVNCGGVDNVQYVYGLRKQ
jgi:hypothetical protein